MTTIDDDTDKHVTNWSGMADGIMETVEYFIGAGFNTGQDTTVDGGMSKMKGSACPTARWREVTRLSGLAQRLAKQSPRHMMSG